MNIDQAVRVWCSPDTDLSEVEAAVNERRHTTVRKVLFIAACVAAAFIATVLSFGLGELDIGYAQSLEIIYHHLIGDPIKYDYIVWDQRVPRGLLGLVTGAVLGVSGCVMQGVLKNPLADPYTVGISSGAGFGATLAIAAGITLVSGSLAVVANAFVFALVPLAVILLVARFKGASPTVMIMAGMAVMYIFNAMSSVLQLMTDPDNLAAIYRWQVGTLSGASWDSIPMLCVIAVAGIIVLQFLSRQMNILSTGDESAKAMGLDVEKFRILVLLLVSLMVASVVSYTGLIGFVGLVAPHICRMFVGADYRYLVLSSATFGGALLVVADIIGRTVISPQVLQVGVVTAFIGGPMFLYLILRQKKEVWRRRGSTFPAWSSRTTGPPC